MKKQLLTLAVILGLTIPAIAQLTGYNQYQSMTLRYWFPETGNKIFLSYSNNHLLEYDLDNNSYKLLNDSINAYGYAAMNGDTGVGYVSSPYDYAYYTHNNWKTYKRTTTRTGMGIKQIVKTSTGFVGINDGSSSNRIVLNHTTDGVSWAAATPDLIVGKVPYYYLNEMDGKTFFFSTISNKSSYRVSYDGGKNFTTNTMVAPALNGNLTYLVAFDSLNMLAVISNGLVYYTVNGGQKWDAMPSSVLQKKEYIYAAGLDSIYYTNSNVMDSIFLSTDTGSTFSFYSKNLPQGLQFGDKITKYGDYLMGETKFGLFYAKSINSSWQYYYQRILGASTLDFKGSTGIVAGKLGVSVTNNNGHYFNVMDKKFSEAMNASKVMSDTVMFLADGNSNIFKTSDGGKTWNHCSGSGSIYALGGRDFYATSTGDTMILIRGGSNHLKSKDRGVSWGNLFSGFGVGGDYDGSMSPNGKMYYIFDKNIEEVNPGNGNRTPINTLKAAKGTIYGYGIKMYDNKVGYCWARDSATGHFMFYKTTDAWVNYTAQGNATGLEWSYTLKPVVHLVSADTIYAHQLNPNGLSNVLFHSFNGGVSWNHDTIKNFRHIAPSSLTDIHFFDGKTFISIIGGTIFLNKITSGGGGTSNIESIPLESSLKLYPNPTTSILNIEFKSKIDQISIFDLSGREIMTKKDIETTFMDVSELQAGTYLVRIIANNKRVSQLFIKQ